MDGIDCACLSVYLLVQTRDQSPTAVLHMFLFMNLNERLFMNLNGCNAMHACAEAGYYHTLTSRALASLGWHACWERRCPQANHST